MPRITPNNPATTHSEGAKPGPQSPQAPAGLSGGNSNVTSTESASSSPLLVKPGGSDGGGSGSTGEQQLGTPLTPTPVPATSVDTPVTPTLTPPQTAGKRDPPIHCLRTQCRPARAFWQPAPRLHLSIYIYIYFLFTRPD